MRSIFMSAAPAGDDTLQEDDLVEVLEALLRAKDKAYELGLKLKLPSHEARSIRDNYAKPEERLSHIIEMFLKQVEPRPTWRVIVNALRSPLVNLPRLANEIEDAHFSKREVETIESMLYTSDVGEKCGHLNFLLFIKCLHMSSMFLLSGMPDSLVKEKPRQSASPEPCSMLTVQHYMSMCSPAATQCTRLYIWPIPLYSISSYSPQSKYVFG